MQEAIDAGMMYAALTGGECLASPDFERLYLFLHSRGIQVAILTNGVLLDEARIHFFKEHPPSCIYVTLYGDCEETYERVTGYRQFERVMRNLRMANEALLPIRISITPNRYLGDSIEALLQCAASTGIAFDVGSSLFSPREETGRNDGFRDLEVEDYVRIFKMEQAIKGYLPPVECETDPPAPNGDCNGEAPRGLRCGAGRSTFTVTWDGTIMPCNRLLHLGVPYERGGFIETWKQLNQHAMNYLLPAECETCNHRYASRDCAAAHQGKAGHADPEQCKWCKAMVKAGFAQLVK